MKLDERLRRIEDRLWELELDMDKLETRIDWIEDSVRNLSDKYTELWIDLLNDKVDRTFSRRIK